SFAESRARQLVGAVVRAAPEFHGLCRWGIEATPQNGSGSRHFQQFTSTDSAGILSHGVELGIRTWSSFLRELGWSKNEVDKVICHQVGASHRASILKSLSISESRDFPTYPFLGNMGTVSLPLSAALAEDREFLNRGDRVAFLGIGSGLNCLMLGLEW